MKKIYMTSLVLNILVAQFFVVYAAHDSVAVNGPVQRVFSETVEAAAGNVAPLLEARRGWSLEEIRLQLHKNKSDEITFSDIDDLVQPITALDEASFRWKYVKRTDAQKQEILQILTSALEDDLVANFSFTPDDLARLEKSKNNDGCKKHILVQTYRLDIDTAQLYLHGDLHGDVKPIVDLLERLAEQNLYDKSTGKLGEHIYIALLGDYIDRGPDSWNVLEQIAKLKQENPKQVILLRGNHEVEGLAGKSSHGLVYDEKLCSSDALTAYTRLPQMVVFDFMQLGEQKARIALMHGGPAVAGYGYTSGEFPIQIVDFGDDNSLGAVDWYKNDILEILNADRSKPVAGGIISLFGKHDVLTNMPDGYVIDMKNKQYDWSKKHFSLYEDEALANFLWTDLIGRPLQSTIGGSRNTTQNIVLSDADAQRWMSAFDIGTLFRGHQQSDGGYFALAKELQFKVANGAWKLFESAFSTWFGMRSYLGTKVLTLNLAPNIIGYRGANYFTSFDTWALVRSTAMAPNAPVIRSNPNLTLETIYFPSVADAKLKALYSRT